MNAPRPRGSNVFKVAWAVITETQKESRGFTPPLLAVGSGLAFVLVGRNIPTGLEAPGSLAAAFAFGCTCMVLGIMALAFGAWTLARDERSGFAGVLLSKPASGAAYFIGRFMGIAIRLTLILFLALAVNGLLLQWMEPETRFFETEAAERFLSGEMEQPLHQPTILAPHGPAAQWTFKAFDKATPDEIGLQIKLRPRYPRGMALKSALPLQVTVLQSDQVLLNKTIVLKNRKSLPLSFETQGVGRIRVRLAVTGGQNFLEVSGLDCHLVHGESPPLFALLQAGISFLPFLLLMLCAGLVFSSFVSAGTAFLAGSVLTLLVITAPSLSLNLDLMAAGNTSHDCPACRAESLDLQQEGHSHTAGQTHDSPGAVLRGFITAAKSILELLPDPREGAGMEALSRQQLPTARDLQQPWKEALPLLAVLLVIGALPAGRRRT